MASVSSTESVQKKLWAGSPLSQAFCQQVYSPDFAEERPKHGISSGKQFWSYFEC